MAFSWNPSSTTTPQQKLGAMRGLRMRRGRNIVARVRGLCPPATVERTRRAGTVTKGPTMTSSVTRDESPAVPRYLTVDVARGFAATAMNHRSHRSLPPARTQGGTGGIAAQRCHGSPLRPRHRRDGGGHRSATGHRNGTTAPVPEFRRPSGPAPSSRSGSFSMSGSRASPSCSHISA